MRVELRIYRKMFNPATSRMEESDGNERDLMIKSVVTVNEEPKCATCGASKIFKEPDMKLSSKALGEAVRILFND